MSRTTRLVLCLTLLVATVALLGQAYAAARARAIPSNHASQTSQSRPDTALNPALRRPVVSTPLRLEVRLSTDHWDGDIHVPERWANDMRLDQPASLHFRYTQPTMAPTTVSYEVRTRVLRPRPVKESGRRPRPTAAVPLAPVAAAMKTLATGTLGTPPGKGKSAEFDIDFTLLLPAKPDGRDYLVRLVGPGSGGAAVPWSRDLTVSYKQAEMTQFPSPTLTRVAGTTDALGHELKQGQTPLAVITQVFRVEGVDLDEVPGETVIEILKGSKVIAELRPVKELTRHLQSGGLSLAVKMPDTVARGTYQVRVKNPWGTTGPRPVFVGGNRTANVGAWRLFDGGSYSNHDWTEECQGVATDGTFWYTASNMEDKQRIYKFTIGMQLVGEVDMGRFGSAHVSAPCYFDGKLYVPLEGPTQLVVMPVGDLGSGVAYQLQGYSPTAMASFSWCAINPISGELYTSRFTPSYDYVHALPANTVERYRKGEGNTYVYAGSVRLASPVTRVQGGAITSGGKLLLVNDAEPFGIHVYNAFTGAYYGAVPYSINTAATVAEESEGMAVSPPRTVAVGGSPANVHLVILDNDAPDQDDVLFKHVTVPSLEDLFGL